MTPSLNPFAVLLLCADGMQHGAATVVSDQARAAAAEIDPLLVASNQGTATAALESGDGLAVAAAVLRGLAQLLHLDASGG